MEQDDLLPSPTFSAPNVRLPVLAKGDVSVPGFVEVNPDVSPYGPWPQLSAAMSEPTNPALPEPERPDTLIYPAENAHALAGPTYEPEMMAWQRPGEPESAARALVLSSPDETSLPPQLTYAQLYTRDDEMTWRKRHFAMLEPGLTESVRHDDGQ